MVDHCTQTPRRPTPANRSNAWVSVLLLAMLTCCRSTPQMPEGQGRGLIAHDPSPPADAILYPRPKWHAGDRMVFLRGGAVRVAIEVTAADDDGYMLTDTRTGARMRRDLDLGNVADLAPVENGDIVLRSLAPRDIRFHWPLWVGKRWRCSLVDKTPGGDAVPLEVDYVVEGLDTVTVPAGTFKALRITRQARIEGNDAYYKKCSLVWFSPDAGLEVRQLADGLLIELQEWTKGNTSPDRSP